MSIVHEKCSCGASWVGDSTQREDLGKFREAHAACRSPQPSSNEEKLREALREIEEVAEPYEDRQDDATKILHLARASLREETP